MSDTIQPALVHIEQLLQKQQLRTEDHDALQQLLDTVQQLQADNKRLRTALVKANSKKPKMSSRLKDALYE
ncbi:hypothetical protein [Paenibacillus hunanensis]|uniref:Cell shape-determining protein MreC n=1 Tax=Paenibacillus hunanensis TaxID=539262 RepID=A0ABU1IVJ9_9BACL|nr:hypothetical protein [Paenibacillus hunanensis]MCL9660292.1 hypothetical protein [Paenibacillus hunanensis]MDR6243281.1 cell shape-determining protein MreC [Paenibacillus hunanensis]GGJ10430.1 hypothetical protein GCM10008022_19460 [Paenibacillus hunanensis]